MNISDDGFPTFVSTEKKILIIGNGFDLALHLPTSYSEFIKFLNKFKNNKRNSGSFDYLFDNLITIEKYNNLKSYYELSEISFDISKITGYESNIWYKHFSNILDLETWIDFENEIEKVLNNTAIFFKKYEEKIRNGEDGKSYSFINQEDVKVNFALQKLYSLLCDFEILIGNSLRFDRVPIGYNGKYENRTSIITSSDASEFKINENFFINNSLDKSKVIDYLLKHLDEFISIFYNYFNFIVSPIYENMKKILPNVKDFDCDYDYLFSFNYTKSFAKFISAKNTYHLHGSSKDNLVLGVNLVDNEALTNAALGFTKYYQNIFKNTHALIFINNEFSENDSCCFYIFGHSLGLSDKKYIDQIIEMLQNKKKEHSLTIYYHNPNSKATLLKNLLSMYDHKLIESYFSKNKIRLLPTPILLPNVESTKQ